MHACMRAYTHKKAFGEKIRGSSGGDGGRGDTPRGIGFRLVDIFLRKVGEGGLFCERLFVSLPMMTTVTMSKS